MLSSGATHDGALVAQIGQRAAPLAVQIEPRFPGVLGSSDADRLVEFIERGIAGAVPVPETLDGSRPELLALVGAENLEIDGELHAVARIVEAHGNRQV